jgi:hypothetical protein
MIVINYNVEALADSAYDLFVYGLKELEQEHSILIEPIIEKDRAMKRITLHGYKNQMDDDLIEQCNDRFKKSFKYKGVI